MAILILSKIVLCATGAEALYADMGHLGRKPIRTSLCFVFFTLCIIYLGQGAFLLAADERVRAMDITEIDASIDTADQRTVRLAALLVLEAAAGLASR